MSSRCCGGSVEVRLRSCWGRQFYNGPAAAHNPKSRPQLPSPLLLPPPLSPPHPHPAGVCTPGEAYPLWEIPLWAVLDASQKPVASMDPSGDAYQLYKQEVSKW